MTGMDGFGQQLKLDKWMKNLEDDMRLIVPFIEDRNVTDIAIGINGELIVKGFGMGKKFTGIFLTTRPQQESYMPRRLFSALL